MLKERNMMNKWFSSAWFMTDQCTTGDEIRSELHGPFVTDREREAAIGELVEENDLDYMLAIVRFDIEGECVPELVE